MAISTQDINLVKRKVFNYLSSGASSQADVFAKALFDQFFRYLSQHGQNPDLQFIPFAAADIVATTGYAAADAACKLYAVYMKKASTNGTDAYLAVFDDPVDDCDGATDARLSMGFLAASDAEQWIKKDGIAMAAGVVVTSYTDYDGTTKSAAADAGNGFVIIGNP